MAGLKRFADIDASTDIYQLWSKRGKLTIPSTIRELQAFMYAPLTENEKIPISPRQLHDLLSTASNELQDRLTRTDVDTLFRLSDTDFPTMFTAIFVAAVLIPPPVSGTGNVYHHFWDSNIRRIIEFVVPSGRVIRRDSKEHAAIRKLRPNFGYLLDDRCIFRGGEKGPEDPGDPKHELSQTLDWDYGSAPYLLGYYCKGTKLTLVAILKPGQGNLEPKVQDLATVDLKTRKGRITNIRYLINLSFLFQELVNLMRPREAEFTPMKKDLCTIELTARHVIKRYTCPNADQKVDHLRNIYSWLVAKQVPNADSVYFSSDKVIVLQPRGHRVEPRTEKELLEAISCILQVLKAIHPVLFHRDIRWPNVIRRRDDTSQWFLIDWEDAQGPPTEGVKHFASESHSPRIFQDGHGGEVDIWGVGHLITEFNVIGLSPELRKIEESPSAEEAWNKMRRYVDE